MRFIFTCLALFCCLEAKIVQTNRIEDGLKFLNKTSWLLLNIDDTLIEGENQLGRAKWADHEMQKLLRRGLSVEEAQKSFVPQWMLSQILCPVKTVEPETAAMVAKAQEIARHVLGLTARAVPMASLTREQLSRLRIDLSKTAPALPLQFNWGETVYRQGIWFQTKGEAVASLLANLSDRPTRIVFINDEKGPLEAMEKALKALKIEFIGIHYTKAGEWPFDARIADFQYGSLPDILSDAEARHSLSSTTNSYSAGN